VFIRRLFRSAAPAPTGKKQSQFPSSLSDLEIKGVHNAIIAKIFSKKIKYRAANAFGGHSLTAC
jgi:hypothetical protein